MKDKKPNTKSLECYLEPIEKYTLVEESDIRNNTSVGEGNSEIEGSDGPGIRKVWLASGSDHFMKELTSASEILDNSIYRLECTQGGELYLSRMSEDKFGFDYKLYGLEEKLINRFVKTKSHTKGNLGLLLNGIKGTGKTVTAKVICNKLNVPVVVISEQFSGIGTFLNDIQQELVVFVDEYEKIFKKDNSLLTVMDGALNSRFKRTFILTTNTLTINDNLLQRPSRVRYLKTFTDLTVPLITEIVDDILVNKEHRVETIKFISRLETITIDIVKAVVQEVNIHDELPVNFQDVFNVKKLDIKSDISYYNGKKFVLVKEGVSVDPRDISNVEYIVDNEYTFRFRDTQHGWINVGRIVEIMDKDIIKVHLHTNKDREAKLVNSLFKVKTNQDTVILKVDAASELHRNFTYGF